MPKNETERRRKVTLTLLMLDQYRDALTASVMAVEADEDQTAPEAFLDLDGHERDYIIAQLAYASLRELNRLHRRIDTIDQALNTIWSALGTDGSDDDDDAPEAVVRDDSALEPEPTPAPGPAPAPSSGSSLRDMQALADQLAGQRPDAPPAQADDEPAVHGEIVDDVPDEGAAGGDT